VRGGGVLSVFADMRYRHGRTVRYRRKVSVEQRSRAEYQHLSHRALEEATWPGINWDKMRFTVHASKTEHHADGGVRQVPIFPELYPYLRDAFEDAEPGTVYCCPQYVNASQMYRKIILQVIKQAGLTPWPKIFQNCRATRETELVETYPAHVACKWIGNSLRVASEHYLQVTEEHFKKAVHFPVQYDAAWGRTDSPSDTQGDENPVKEAPNECREPQLVGPVGFEPTTKKL
jgi:hypothetical protein